MPEQVSKDAAIRVGKELANAVKVQIENEANKGLNLAINQALEAAIAALPPPLNFGAKAASDGIYTVLKLEVNSVKNPTNLQDSLKSFALAIAFAIIKAIWCFIKSLLHPLPIIGSFFPLCTDDPEAATETAAGAAPASDSDNIAANSAERQQNNISNDARREYEKQLQRAQEEARKELKEELPEPVLGPQGMTFDEYVATIPTQQTNQSIQNLTQQSNGATSANLSNNSQVVEWEDTNRDPNELRRLFGL